LGGTLNLTLLGSSPQAQTRFYLVTYASRAGTTFATINLPTNLLIGHWADGYNDSNPIGFWVEDVVH
jgi:hypothetical protein